MTHHDPNVNHSHQPVEPARDPASSWTTYAIVKYGFILIITIVVLYFVARYLIPLIT